MNYQSKEKLTHARYFLEPANSNHRQYEALRAYFVEGCSAREVAGRFGYAPGSLRVLAHQFRQNPDREFFLPSERRVKPASKRKRLRDSVLRLRKLNLSIHDISRTLTREGNPVAPSTVSTILTEEGFARLPRRADEERPREVRPATADAASVGALDLTPRRLSTKFGGLFLFVPLLVQADLKRIVCQAGLPGTKQIPADCAVRSLLGLKLFGNARHSHVMSHVFDEGLALFAGLNIIPKRSFLTEYSCRIGPGCYPKWMRRWFDAVGRLGLEWGTSFDVDFHTIPFHGEEALIEKHYVSKRSRKQRGILAFLAQDADRRVFCYGNADLRKDEQNDEILQFVRFWKRRTGKLPEELVFDSRLTIYPNLSRLNQKGIQFITLRRRSQKLLRQIACQPPSAWRRIELEGVSRAYRTPRILDQRVRLSGYDGQLRQLVAADLGHEAPTVLLTNQLRRSPAKLIGRYAQRMLIENGIEDGIDFFHMDALSSAVALKVNCDLQLTLMGSSLYRLLAARIGQGYEAAKSSHVFRDFIDATARITIDERNLVVRFQKRAHNPLLLEAGFDKMDLPVPWLGRKRLHFVFG
jgi:transposase